MNLTTIVARAAEALAWHEEERRCRATWLAYRATDGAAPRILRAIARDDYALAREGRLNDSI
jgi:hypothetical protein